MSQIRYEKNPPYLSSVWFLKKAEKTVYFDVECSMHWCMYKLAQENGCF